MPKSTSVYTRIEPEIKEQAEQILSELGIPMANAINLFLRQVVLQKGIPFDVKLPQKKLLDYSELSQEQFNIEIEKGITSFNADKIIPAKQVREKMKRLYDV